MPYGPDNNLALIQGEPWCIKIEVPPQATPKLTFSSNAGWEQALLIYTFPGLSQVIEKGTYFAPGDANSRNLDPAQLPKNATNGTQSYLISGWHKNSEPSASESWHQSKGRLLSSDGVKFIVGFDDSGNDDGDFNDIMCTIKWEF